MLLATPRGCRRLALLAICVASFHLRAEHISASLPYPQHLDERVIAWRAGHILKTGDFDPGSFHYPSFPKYLAASAMAVGYVVAAPELNLQDGVRIENIGDVSFPFYTAPPVVEKARQLFALLSVVALAASGAAAQRLLRRPGALLLAPLVLALSNYYFSMSWRYMNVDIVGACFVTLGMAAILQISPASPRRFAAAPAVCAGLAAGSKYTYGLLILPLLIAVWLLVERGRRLEAMVIAAATSGLSFLAVTPYSVIELPRFLNSLSRERRHYALETHPGDSGDPGIDTLLFYVDALSRDFGGLGLVLGLIGLVSIAASDWRRALVFASFPAALAVLLSRQSAEFQRNILPVFPLVAVMVAAGVYSLHGLAMRAPWIRRVKTPAYRKAIGGAVFLGVFAGGLHAPIREFSRQQLQVAGDSRVNAVAWIQEHAAADTTLIVPEELQFDSRPLTAAGYPIRVAKFKELGAPEDVDALVEGLPGPVLALFPFWCATPWGDSPDEAAVRAAELNEAMAQASLVPLVDFHHGGCTLLNFRIPNNGNPAFSIAGRTGGGPDPQ